MRRTKFLVSSLLAAGFGSHQDVMASDFARATTGGVNDGERTSLLRLFTQDHDVTLADHRSHSSHSSHRSGSGGGGHYSHTSHRSSTAGGYSGSSAESYVPQTVYSPPETPALTPTPAYSPPQRLFAPETRASAPPSDGLPALSGRTKRFQSIVKRVQIALLARDLYTGSIDGIVGPGLRSALRKFQRTKGLGVTGTITPETLDGLMVSSQ